MLFNVAGLLNSEVGVTRTESFSDETIETDEGAFMDIEGTVEMLRTDSTILVTVGLSANSNRTCGRCLEPATIHLEVSIEEEFHPINADLGTGSSRGRPGSEDFPEDEALAIDDRNVLDLSEVMRQAMTAALPIATVCRPNCAGICPICLADRNRKPCDCEEESVDSALAPLAKLLTRDAN